LKVLASWSITQVLVQLVVVDLLSLYNSVLESGLGAQYVR
jgi:hypothetical protein